MSRPDGLLAFAAWADGKAAEWREEAGRYQAMVGGTVHRVRLHGANRMATAALLRADAFSESAAKAREMALLCAEEKDNG
jgi:hypothetical protein